MRSKKLLVLYCVLLAVALLTMSMLWSMRKPAVRDYPAIATEGVLRLITDYNPSGYYVTGDTIAGFQYELAQAIAGLSGLEVEIGLEMSLPKSFEALNSQACDVVARNIPVTSQGKENYLFTEPVILNKQVLIQRTAQSNEGSQPIRNQLDLADKTLYIPKDSPALLRLQNLAREIGDTIHVKEDSLYAAEQLIIMVAKGDIDYAVCDQLIASGLQKKYPEIDISTDISFTQLESWAVRKDAPILLDSLNSWLRQIREKGLFDQIYKKYY